MIGKVISHYQIIEKLGEGGMGVVYKAEDTKLKRIVALKFLPSSIMASEAEKTRFVHEAQAAAALNHPNICTIHEIDEADGQFFIAMEFVEGQSLKAKIEAGPLKIDETLNIAMQTAEGLQAAHEKSITHRDIKPANIMLTTKGQAKIMDFGLAKLAGRTVVTKEGTTLGTVAYMSPEQGQGEKVDQRTDIWSFGVVFYEMITGQHPFKGEYDQAVMYSIMHEEPEPITGLRTGVPMELERIARKCLEKDPANRYQHADELIVDLRQIKSAESRPRASRVSRATAGVKTSKFPRKKVWIGAAAGAVVVLVMLWILSQFFSGRQSGMPAPGEKSIAVMYFDNRSKEPDLDKMLVDMLTTNLARHEEIEVVSSQRLFDILKNLGQMEVQTIDRNVATQVANRAGVKTMLLGSIVQIGDQIRINSQLTDVKTGSIIGSELVKGEKIEDLFAMVDSLTEKVADRLGIMQVANQPPLKITEVTTHSFEAYRFYQRGLENWWRFEFSEARENFQRAIAVDSTFAMAHLILGLMQVSVFDPFTDLSSARNSLRLAHRHAAKATKKEQLLIKAITTLYDRDYPGAESMLIDFVERYPYEMVGIDYLWWISFGLNKLDQAIWASEVEVKADPAHAGAYNQLAYAYAFKNEADKAIAAVKKYMALDPDVENAYDSACEVYIQLGQYGAARDLCEKALQMHPEWTRFYEYLGYSYLFEGDGDKARENIRRLAAADSSRKAWTAKIVGCSYVFEAQYRNALAEFQRALALALRSGQDLEALRGYFDLSKLYAAQGNYTAALQTISDAKQFSAKVYPGAFNPVPIWAEYLAGRVNVRKGELSAAESKAAKMMQMIEGDKYDGFLEFSHLLQAEVHVARGKGEAAQKALNKAPGLRNYFPRAHVLLADTHRLLNDVESAITEYLTFDDAIALRNYIQGGDYFDYFDERSKVNFHLAKLYEKKGEPSKAIEYYSKALEQWKHADEDLPELIEAKTRLARLSGK
jgi:tetratricopeptide (TPR) repeat protein/predicted Ser/Thr protein kinase